MKIVTTFVPQLNLATQFNPVTGLSSGTFNAQLRPGRGKILFWNETFVDLKITFPNSSNIEYVPQQAYRIFDLDLPTWNNIQWQSAQALATTFLSNPQQATVTVVTYEADEDIPAIGQIANYINLWANSTIISTIGTAGSGIFNFTANGQTTTAQFNPFNNGAPYLQKIILSPLPTGSGSNRVDVSLTDNGGNDWGTYRIGGSQNNTQTPIQIDLIPAISYATQGFILVTATSSNVATGGNGTLRIVGYSG